MSKFCGACGAARDPQARFCPECGAPFGATPAPPAAPYPPAEAVGTHTIPTQATLPGAAPGRAPGQGPEQVYGGWQALPPPPRRSGGTATKWLAGSVAVVAVVAGGVVAWQFLKPGGGTGSPEAAADKFVTAIASQDLAGTIESIAPGEVTGMEKVFDSARAKLGHAGVVDGSGPLLAAADVKVSGLKFSVHDEGTNLARVELTAGRYDVTYDPSKLPSALKAFAQAHPDTLHASGDLVASFKDAIASQGACVAPSEEECHLPQGAASTGPELVAEKQGGGWYVSLFGTAAQLVVDSIDADADAGIQVDPDFKAYDDAPAPITGKTPQDVVDHLVSAVNKQDVGALLANLPADEARVLQPYGAAVQDLLVGADLQGEAKVDALNVDSTAEGDYLKVSLRSAKASADFTDDDGDEVGGQLTLQGMCYSGWDLGDTEPDQDCVPDQVKRTLGIDSWTVWLRKVSGGYQFDPVATAANNAATVIDAVPTSLISTGVQDFLRDAGVASDDAS